MRKDNAHKLKTKIMKLNKTYRAARKACGECLGRLTTDDIYSKLDLDELLEVQMDGFVGLDYQSYYNSFVPDMGMTREEVNRTSGYFTHIHQWGAGVPTAVGPDWYGEVEPCSGEKDGFYWVTAGEKTLEQYISEAEAAVEAENEN